ncbi:hypothetical protein LC724_21240 [Blautia sp. RD014234]|nr:hypothetical protein [Blautia parvula]
MRRLKGLLCCILVIVLMFSLSGCGVKVSTKSPESVTKSIVNAYQKGDTEAAKNASAWTLTKNARMRSRRK